MKDLECDQLLIDNETLYSGESKSGYDRSDSRLRHNRLAVAPSNDSLMTTPEFKFSHSSSTVSSIKGGATNGDQGFTKTSKAPQLFKINLKSAF